MVSCFGMRLSSGVANECWDVLEVMLEKLEVGEVVKLTILRNCRYCKFAPHAQEAAAHVSDHKLEWP